MKKNNNNGFLVMETLIVTTFISAVLIFLFLQFKIVYNRYDMANTYDNPNSLYNSFQIKKFLSSTNYSVITTALEKNLFIDLSNCPINLVMDYEFCQNLFSDLRIKHVYFTYENLNPLINYKENEKLFSENLKKYIDYINFDEKHVGYRIIIEFENEQFSSINFI